MTPAHRTPRIDLTGPCLLLGDTPAPGVDVLLLDLTGVEPADVSGVVAAAEADHRGGIGVIGGRPPAVREALAAGVGLVVLDVAGTDPAEVVAVVQTGAVTVLHHPDPAAAVGAVDLLTASGLDTTRVVVEVGPDRDIVEEVTVLERSAFGFRVGAVVALPPEAGSWSEPVRRGWEIGTLTALLGAGVATLRGTDIEVARRVAATLHEIDAAGIDAADRTVVGAPSTASVAEPAPKVIA